MLVRVDTATGLLAVEGRASQLEPFIAATEPKRSTPPPEPEEEDEDTEGPYVGLEGDPSEQLAQ